MQRRLRDFTDRAFVPREVFFRSADRFHHLRLSVRTQKLAASCIALLVAWGVIATVGIVVDRYTIAARERAVEAQRSAYVELLAEVDDFFVEFARITQELQDDQTKLVKLLEKGSAGARDTARLRDLLPALDKNPARDGPAGDAVQTQMSRLGEALQGIADRNATLQADVSRMRRLVQEAESVRSDFAATRSELVQRLTETEEDLTHSRKARRELEALARSLREELERAEAVKASALRDKAEMAQQIARLQRQSELVGELRSELERAKELEADALRDKAEMVRQIARLQRQTELVAKLRSELERAKELEADALSDKAEMAQQIARLQRQSEFFSAIQSELERRAAAQEEARKAAEAKAESLRFERDLLARRVDGLEQHLVELRDAGQSVIERFSERTRLTLDDIEKTVEMTGLDVETLIAAAAPRAMGQGGPFIADDEILSDFDTGLGLEASVTSLEEQLNRWQALQEILRSMPLTAPLDQFRISSSFGSRKDPVNGRKAKHLGVDFSAPLRSGIFATAPGKVVFAGWRGRYGRLVEIEHGHGIRTRYAHLKKILVEVGQEVGHREKIGLVGSSGRSTGPHVHYEIRYRGQAQNPMKFLKAGNYVFKG